jgi:O-antigen/teichoic acid export membrane protein/O-antigen ligase
VAAVVIAVAHWRAHRSGDRLVLPLAVTGFLVWVAASFEWSGDHHDSAHQIIEFLAVAVTGVILAMVLRRDELLRSFAIGSKLLIAVTGISIVVAYHYSTAPPVLDPVPGWHGPLGGKNTLGFLMAIAIVTFGYERSIRRTSRWWLAAAVVLLIGSRSGAGLCVTLLVVAVVIWERALRGVTTRTNRILYKLASVVLALGGGIFLLTDFPAATSVVGKSSTLTGRTHIWSTVISAIGHNFAHGYGYAGVWLNKTGETATLWKAIGFKAYEAHDVYLDLLLQLGVVGLVLVVLVIGATVARLLPLFRGRSASERWLLIVFLAVLVEGVVESDFLGQDVIMFAAVATASVVLGYRLRGRLSTTWSPRPRAERPGYHADLPEPRLPVSLTRPEIVRDAGWGTGLQVVSVAGSAFTFLVLARDLGPVGFGYYAAIAGIVGLIGTVVNAWVGFVVNENVVRDRQPVADSIASLSSWVAIFAVSALVATVALGKVVVPYVPVTTTLLFVGGTVVGSSLLRLGASTVQSLFGYALSARMPMLLQGMLLLTMVGLWLGHDITLLSVALTTLLVTTGVGVLSVLTAQRSCRVRFRFGRPRVADLRRGSLYAAVLLCFATEEDIDKPLLVRFGFSHVAGPYSAAYNIVTMALLPLNAATSSTHLRFLAHDPDAIGEHTRRSLKMTIPSGIYGAVATAGIIAGAPLVPKVLGSAYAGTTTMIRLLAALVLFRSLTVFAFNGLMGIGRGGWRTFVLAASALINVGLNVALIPLLSWKGAVIATIAGESVFLCLTWVGLLWFQYVHDEGVRRRQEPAPPLS